MRNAPPPAGPPRHPEGSILGPDRAQGQPNAPENGAVNEAANAAVRQAVMRLAAILDEETEALKEHRPIDLKEYNNRKAQGLLELDRASAILGSRAPEAPTLALLGEVREKLAANGRLLALHIDAVREVAAIIADTIREAESDGTYTKGYRSKGQAP